MMRPFDLVLTPSWRWHEHGDEGAPAIWLDGLDIPIVQRFAAGFAEREGNIPAATSVPTGSCQATYGSGLKPVVSHCVHASTPMFHFPYAKWALALDGYANSTPVDAHTGWMMEFTNPVDGGAVTATISAFC